MQDGKTDLPVIGTDTVKNVAAAGLAGIAIEAGSALIMNRAAVHRGSRCRGHLRLRALPATPIAT